MSRGCIAILVYIVVIIYLVISIGIGKAIGDSLEKSGSSKGVVITVFLVVAVGIFWLLFTFVNPVIANMFAPK